MAGANWIVTAQSAVHHGPHGARGDSSRRPFGTHHARRHDTPRTACGLPAKDWPTFPTMVFSSSTSMSDVCEYCVDAVDQETTNRRTVERFQDQMIALVAFQARSRGDWPDPREAVRPAPPWPARSGVVLEYLLWRAETDLATGADPRPVLERLATLAWFEGGVTNYDRGQRDARDSGST